MPARYVLACFSPHISAKLGQIREIKISMESEHAGPLEHIIWPEHAGLHAYTLCAYIHRPISQPNWIESERSKYLWNQENMPDLSEHKIWPRAHKLACFILSPTEKRGEVDRLNIKFAEVESQLLRSRACEARRSWLSTSVNLKETARGALEWSSPMPSLRGKENFIQGLRVQFRVGVCQGSLAFV